MSVHEKKPIFFVHIPKTGGMSFLRTLEQLASHEVTIRLQEFSWLFQAGNWPEDILTQYELISGHIPYSNICNDLDAHYVTMLRNPVDQVISYYWQIRRPVNSPKPINAKRSANLIDFDFDKSLEKVILDKEAGINTYIDNIQTRMLGWMGPCTQTPTLSDKQWIEVLECAKSRLVNEFAFFGITEYMTSSLHLLMNVFKTKSINPVPIVINKRLPHQNEPVSAETSALIAHQNKYDQYLYEFALARFRDRCKESIDSLE